MALRSPPKGGDYGALQNLNRFVVTRVFLTVTMLTPTARTPMHWTPIWQAGQSNKSALTVSLGGSVYTYA
jgi:hypothetical protein